MTRPEDKAPNETNDEQAPFYILFRELKKAETEHADVTPEEIDEIELVRRIVMDVCDEHPTFMTST